MSKKLAKVLASTAVASVIGMSFSSGDIVHAATSKTATTAPSQQQINNMVYDLFSVHATQYYITGLKKGTTQHDIDLVKNVVNTLPDSLTKISHLHYISLAERYLTGTATYNAYEAVENSLEDLYTDYTRVAFKPSVTQNDIDAIREAVSKLDSKAFQDKMNTMLDEAEAAFIKASSPSQEQVSAMISNFFTLGKDYTINGLKSNISKQDIDYVKNVTNKLPDSLDKISSLNYISLAERYLTGKSTYNSYETVVRSINNLYTNFKRVTFKPSVTQSDIDAIREAVSKLDSKAFQDSMNTSLNKIEADFAKASSVKSK
ncbi:hypothetical protein [Paenilisteria rocourtiae]|uniref:Uncharacterized protein n=1 Tax=Listeria rocourtiae TaxID=647910 RepID=A0A4R6ZLA4_9LIST|nr:hypothetical protein [Listeria rocourtiae]TDR52829.1 hypothetical protein DFP96_10634 [Listeria rocourtiae]